MDILVTASPVRMETIMAERIDTPVTASRIHRNDNEYNRFIPDLKTNRRSFLWHVLILKVLKCLNHKSTPDITHKPEVVTYMCWWFSCEPIDILWAFKTGEGTLPKWREEVNLQSNIQPHKAKSLTKVHIST